MRAVRPQVLLALFAAVALTMTVSYFGAYPLPGFLSRLRELATALAALLLSAAAGETLWRRFGGPRLEGSLEEFLFHVGTGLPVLSLGLLGLGAAGFYRPGPILAFVVLLSLLCARAFTTALSRLAALRGAAEGAGPAATGLGLLGFLLALLCAFAPPTYYDSLVYHLALPAKYLQEGRVGFVPYNQYAHFPQNMEMIFGGFLALGNDVSAQVFNVLLGGLTGLAAAGMGRALGGRGGWPLLLFATAPCALLLSSETYVETPMAFATTLGLWAALKALSSGDRRWWIAAGVLGGFNAGVKYTGVLTPALLSGAALLWPRARAWRERGLDALSVGGTAFLLFAPWLLKNFVLTGGNPVFPFLPAFFPAANVYLPVESAKAYFQVLDEYRGSSALLSQLLTNAVALGGGYDVMGDLGWALPVILLPLAFSLWKEGAFARGLLAYVLLHGFLWASMRPVLRFLFPLFPAVCLAGGAGLERALKGVRPILRGAAALWAGLFLLSNGMLFTGVERVRDPFPVATGWQSREDYLLKKIDGYAAHVFCGDALPPSSRLLLIGDQRGYYCRRPYVAPMALLPTPLRAWADGCRDGKSLERKLVESGFTHLYFNRREAERLKGYRVLDLTPSGLRAWDDLLARGKEIYRDASVSIYDLNG